MTKEEFENKLKNKNFTDKELQDLVWEDIYIDDIDEEEYPKIVDTIESSDLDRWTQACETIFKYKNKYYAFWWAKGLTEYQENEFYDQPEEVIKKTRVIEEIYWEAVEEDE